MQREIVHKLEDMSIRLADSHAHLDLEDHFPDQAAVLRRAREAGVLLVINVATGLTDAAQVIATARTSPGIVAVIGVHPHGAGAMTEADLAALDSLAADPKVVAIGEIGLDYHYNFSPKEAQQKVFAAQLVLAAELKLPSVVHCREAITDVRSALKGKDLMRVVLHCCTEEWEDVAELVAQGMLLSFTGIATYPQAESIRRTIRECPIEQMMVETDAPYLAPVPHRGKRNEPAYVVEVARLIAKVKEVSLEEVDRRTTENAVVFFGLPA